MMSSGKPAVADATADAAEPTLGAVLTRFARTAVPSHLYKLLQFGIPFALDFGLHGHWRAALGGAALAALGVWGLADRWLFDAGDRRDRRALLVRYARVVGAVTAAGFSLLLFLLLFLHLLGNAPIS
jgi:hypothetical protein